MSIRGKDGLAGGTGGSRASGGIQGSSGTNVNPVYRQMTPSAQRLRANTNAISRVAKPNTEIWDQTTAIQNRTVRKLTNREDAAFIKAIADISFPKRYK